jgi:hypothetical protein
LAGTRDLHACRHSVWKTASHFSIFSESQPQKLNLTMRSLFLLLAFVAAYVAAKPQTNSTTLKDLYTNASSLGDAFQAIVGE